MLDLEDIVLYVLDSKENSEGDVELTFFLTTQIIFLEFDLAFETVYLSNCCGSEPPVGRRPLKEHAPLKWLLGPAGQKSIDALGFLCLCHVLTPPMVVIA